MRGGFIGPTLLPRGYRRSQFNLERGSLWKDRFHVITSCYLVLLTGMGFSSSLDQGPSTFSNPQGSRLL